MNILTGRLRHPLRIAAVMAALLGAASCGQKGPLYLPDHPPQTVPADADQKTDSKPGATMDDEASGDSGSDPTKRKDPTTVPPGS
jgi:predicted small lipoprotein YifL